MKKTQNYKIYLCLSMLLFSILVSMSCGRLNQKSANEAFLSRNPNYVIVDSGPGEGWEGVVYYHFVFKKPNDEKIYKEIWLFEQKDDGTWKVESQNITKPQ